MLYQLSYQALESRVVGSKVHICTQVFLVLIWLIHQGSSSRLSKALLKDDMLSPIVDFQNIMYRHMQIFKDAKEKEHVDINCRNG